MAGSTLTNRSARLSTGSASGKIVTAAKLVPLRRPQNGSSKNYRAAHGHGGGGDDDISVAVKSNTGIPLPSRRYVLPCLRFRSRKSAAMAFLATSAIFVSICSAFLAYRSLSSMSLLSPSPDHFFLPPAREWGAGRERRREARRGRRRDHSPPAATESDLNSVEYSEYEAYLLNYLFSLRAEGVKSSVLPLNSREPPGQDMGIYASLGCSVFNQLNDDGDRASSSSAAFRKKRMKKMWASHIPSILAASRHADDATYSHRNWTATLLKSLSPYSILDHLPEGRSAEGAGAITTENAERIVGIIARRFLGLLQYGGRAPPADIPPPLRIAVFGGPTVEGKGCRRARVDIPRGSIMANPAFCAFPYRLERFLNALLLPPAVLAQLRRTLGGTGPIPSGAAVNEEVRLVEVINLGEEGTDPEYAAALVRNRMFPPLSNAQVSRSSGYGGGPPDLVIDAYGVDDFGKESADLVSLNEMSQSPSVPAQCSKANRKPPPVIVHAVLEEDAILKQQGLASLMLTAVLGEAVDDAEEAEMSLPDVWDLEGKEAEANGAFGMAGHVASSWALAFNLAYAAIGHCGSVVGIRQRPRVPMAGYANEALSDRCDNGIDPPCTLAFLAGLKGTAPRPSAIAYSLMHFIVENTGWQPESDISTGFARKTGLVGTGTGATMTLLFRNVTRPVRRLDVVTLRSTSEAWSDGTARFVVVTGGDFSHGSDAAEESAEVARETSFEVSANLIVDRPNGEDRHISYHFGLDLTEGENVGQVGTDVLLRIILTKGSRFKVLGLMLCE